jgi:small subunit ribosomal protein S9
MAETENKIIENATKEVKKVAHELEKDAKLVVNAVKEKIIDEVNSEKKIPEEKKKIKLAAKKAGMIVKAKKKTAIARGMIKKGNGTIRINNINLNSYARGYILNFIKEPLEIAPDAIEGYDISINVKGSGYMGQAVAIRSCIAKAIVRAKGKKYKDLFQLYDRMLLVDDVRKVETKKPLGTKARKKRQHSKR